MAVTYGSDPAPTEVVEVSEWGPVLALSQTALGGTAQMATGRYKLVGLNIAESSGTNPARVRIWDTGTGATNGLMVASASVVANTSTQPGGMGDGLLIERGLYVQVLTGSVDVTLYVRHLNRVPG